MHFEASVIIPTFNRSKLLEYSLAALCRQTERTAKFEVIVADDGSSEDTMKIIREFENRLTLKYAYYPDRGYHVTRARNVGIRLAEGNVLIFLDCGNLPGTSFVDAHVACHANTDGVVIGYVYGLQHHADYAHDILKHLDVDDIDRSFAAMKNDARMLDVREDYFVRCRDKLDDISLSWMLFCGGNISAKAKDVRAVGGFDEWFTSWGAEDLEFGYAMSSRGLPVLLSRDGAVVQYPHAKDREQRRISDKRNRCYIAQKWGITPEIAAENHMDLLDLSVEVALAARLKDPAAP